jgi:hypothetical protein
MRAHARSTLGDVVHARAADLARGRTGATAARALHFNGAQSVWLLSRNEGDVTMNHCLSLGYLAWVIGIGGLLGLGGAGCTVRPMYDPAVIPPPVQMAAGRFAAQGSGPNPPASPGASPIGRGAPMSNGGPIEAGCSFTSDQIKGEAGDTFQVSCPDACLETDGYLVGTDVYTSNSSICKAGIHAGAIPRTGGLVVVQLQPGRPAYRGSVRNRLTSRDTGAFRNSFAVIVPRGQAIVDSPPPAAPQIIDAGCSFSSEQIRDEVGTSHVVSCPAGCKTDTSYLFGTDTYTSNSSICKAAIHAGLISPNGGEVVVILDTPKPAFRGSLRNGLQSGDTGSFRGSFRLKRH